MLSCRPIAGVKGAAQSELSSAYSENIGKRTEPCLSLRIEANLGSFIK